MTAITVFTPSYNRADTLHKCYESLKMQKNKDFIWLIIDDGSTDHTKTLVQKWINENPFPIRYHYQENQGMHGAHNAAYRLIDTELNVCIDSDDYLAENAIEKILLFWNENKNDSYAGLIGLDATSKGKVIGTRMPAGVKTSTLIDLYEKYKVKGDKKLVYRSELTNKTPPYPLFPGEKYCPLSYKSILIDQQKPLLIMDEVLCHVEYLEDGSSMNIINQYKKNPQGFLFFRKVAITHAPSFKTKFRESIHFVSSSLLLKKYLFILDSPCKFTTLLATPFGILFFVFIKNTKKNTFLKRINQITQA